MKFIVETMSASSIPMIQAAASDGFQIKTHGKTYLLSRNRTHWVLASKTMGGIIAPKRTQPFTALSIALKDLTKQYDKR
jgi:hypothetical protein